MQIQKIAFTGLFRKNKPHKTNIRPKKPNETKLPEKPNKPQNIYYSNLIVHKQNRYSYIDFKKMGGKMHNDTAKIENAPYNGSLTIKYADFGIKSYYTNGVKDNVEVKEGNTNSIFFYRCPDKKHKNNPPTIKFISQDYQHEFIENYDENGKLCQTEIKHYDKDTLKSSTLTTYDDDGYTILGRKTIFHNGLSKEGIKTVDSFYKEGKLIKKVLKGELVSDNRKADEIIVEYDENETPLYIKEINPRFYENINDESPYASAFVTTTSVKTKKTISQGYKTFDYTKGINPLRKELFEESPMTTRVETPKGNIYYFNGITNEPIAVEHYEGDNKIPTNIRNKQEGFTAKTKEIGSNGLAVSIFEDNSTEAASVLYFRKSYGNWILNKHPLSSNNNITEADE